MSTDKTRTGKYDWHKAAFPALQSIHREDLHLECGDKILFYDPEACYGLVWDRSIARAQVTAPITAPEFIVALMHVGVELPTGDAMWAWSKAITCGLVETPDPRIFVQIVAEMRRQARSHETQASKLN